jgi:hypothetical protein
MRSSVSVLLRSIVTSLLVSVVSVQGAAGKTSSHGQHEKHKRHHGTGEGQKSKATVFDERFKECQKGIECDWKDREAAVWMDICEGAEAYKQSCSKDPDKAQSKALSGNFISYITGRSRQQNLLGGRAINIEAADIDQIGIKDLKASSLILRNSNITKNIQIENSIVENLIEFENVLVAGSVNIQGVSGRKLDVSNSSFCHAFHSGSTIPSKTITQNCSFRIAGSKFESARMYQDYISSEEVSNSSIDDIDLSHVGRCIDTDCDSDLNDINAFSRSLGEFEIFIRKLSGKNFQLVYSLPKRIDMSEVDIDQHIKLNWNTGIALPVDVSLFRLDHVTATDLEFLPWCFKDSDLSGAEFCPGYRDVSDSTVVFPEKIIEADHVSVGRVNLGNGDFAVKLLKNIHQKEDQVIKGDLNLSFFKAMADYYTENGQAVIAQDILLENESRQTVRWKTQGSLYNIGSDLNGVIYNNVKLWMFNLVGSGYNIGRGLFILLIFIVGGSVIFRLGRDCAKPVIARHWRWFDWLFFSFDTVIPFFNLDEKHKNVTFRSSLLKSYIYVIKIYGAVIAFVIIFFLKREFFGTN